jgi:hypothetical protein
MPDAEFHIDEAEVKKIAQDEEKRNPEHVCIVCKEPFLVGVQKKRKICNRCGIERAERRLRKKLGKKKAGEKKYYGEGGWMSAYLKGS